jgi:hypothetical protein
LTGFNPITLDINVQNGAINGLVALVNQHAGTGDTNVLGTPAIPTFVDSATSPDAVGINSTTANLTALPTYVVPLVLVRNTNYPVVNAISNLTSRQVVALETAVNPATFYGGNATNLVYFVGRNSQSAVRTEIDLNIYNSANINSFTNNSTGQPVQDNSADPGLSSAGTLVTVVTALTNSIGTVAVQNITGALAPIAIDGVNYSPTNIINGTYPLWGYENYYYITPNNPGYPSTAQLAVLNAFYASVTNASFQATNVVFTNLFIPNGSLEVTRSYDGGPITPLPGYH